MKFIPYHVTRTFIAVFTWAHHWVCFEPAESSPRPPNLSKIHLHITLKIASRFYKWNISPSFPPKISYAFLLSSVYVPHPLNYAWCNHSNNIRPKYKLWTLPLCRFFQLPLLSSLYGQHSPHHTFLNLNNIIKSLQCILLWITEDGWDSIFGISTHHGLDGQGLDPPWGRDFPYPSRPAPKPTQSLSKRVRGLFSGAKAAKAWCWQPTRIKRWG